MAKDIWISENWMKDPEIAKQGRRTGLRLRFDRDVDPDIRAAFKELAKWSRERFWFPVRVPVYVRSSKTVTARDGDQCVGTFLWPDDHSVEPYIRVAAGDYQDLVNEKGALQAKILVLLPFLHELTHYYQWINSESLTPIGEERQAERYAQDIMDEYLDDLGLLETLR